MLGRDGAREAVQQASTVAPRSPIQDAMNQAGAIRMGVRRFPTFLREHPSLSFGVPEGSSPVIKSGCNKVRQEIGPMQGPTTEPGAICRLYFSTSNPWYAEPCWDGCSRYDVSRAGKVPEVAVQKWWSDDLWRMADAEDSCS